VTDVAIVGVGFTPLVRKTDRTLGSIALDAALDAIGDAGLTCDDIDGYAGTPFVQNHQASGHRDGVDEVSANFMVGALSLPNVRWICDAARGLVTDSIINAYHALVTGTCTHVLIVRAMVNPVGIRYSAVSFEEAGGPAQFSAPYGMHPIGHMALLLRRYFAEYSATKADLYHVAKTLRDHAQLNPHAYWRGKTLSEADYLEARSIFDPMGLHDCDMPVTGAGALVLTTMDRARRLPHRPARIASFATAWEGPRAAFDKAGITQRDVQCAQLYDGYLPVIWYWLEELGFCGKGEAHRFARNGNIALGGALPVSTFGGSIGEGRLNGMGHIREGALQVMGRAGDRQVPNVEHCIVAIGVEFVPGAAFVLRAG
jgi:acetyl-CoA acetyltransferase